MFQDFELPFIPFVLSVLILTMAIGVVIETGVRLGDPAILDATRTPMHTLSSAPTIECNLSASANPEWQPVTR